MKQKQTLKGVRQVTPVLESIETMYEWNMGKISISTMSKWQINLINS